LTVCLEIELSLVELYKGQILYREMLGRLESMGFGLFSVEPGFTDPHTGRVLQFDGILVRTDGRGS
jgi:hypothetical protein